MLNPLSPTIEPPLILALDIGTSNLRALLFDRLGRVVPGITARRPVDIAVDLDGASEAGADALLEDLLACIDGALRQLAAGPFRGAPVAAVAACSFVSNVFGLDESGRPVTPLITYADTRAAAQAQALRRRLDEESCHQRTGVYFHPSYLPARLAWFREERPEWFQKTRRWVSLGEYLLLRLFGETAVSYSAASWTGLLDRRALAYDGELLAACGLDAGQFSPLADQNRSFRGLPAGLGQRWPALGDVPWFLASGDGAAANLGSGCSGPRQVAVTMGTSSAVRAVVIEPGVSVPPGLWCYRVDGRRSLLGGALTEGGNIGKWLSGLLNRPDLRALEGELLERTPDAHGLTCLPMIAGERSPGWAAEARGAFTGLSLATTPLDLLQAAYEGVVCRIARVYELLRPSLAAAEPEIIASGGTLLHARPIQNMLADTLGRPLSLSGEDEASARGAALLALEALGLLRDAAEAPIARAGVVEPDPRRYAAYRSLMARQQDLYEKLVSPPRAA